MTFNDDLLDLRSLLLLWPNPSDQGLDGGTRGAGSSLGYSPKLRNALRIPHHPKMLDRRRGSCKSDQHQQERSRVHPNLLIRKLSWTYVRQFSWHNNRADLKRLRGLKQQICDETFLSITFVSLNQSFK